MTTEISHLAPVHWSAANRMLVTKAIAEFAHERLITPTALPAGWFTLASEDGTVEYRFRATRLMLYHWRIESDSVMRIRAGIPLQLDAVDFILELRDTLGLSDRVLPLYVEEITSTVASAAFKHAADPVSAAELAGADFQAIESGMTEGHPCFVANNGRIGFDIEEYRRFAPEAGRPVRLVWLAVHRDRAMFTSTEDIDYRRLIEAELDTPVRERFATRLAELGLPAENYLLMPVHPWQWHNRLAVTFAGEVALRRIVYLGAGDDEHRAQQSIRTFFNTTDPRRHYVKTALSVLNMGFLRGLSAEYMAATPAINDWLAGLIARDDVLRRTGFSILRERAAIGYHHEQYEVATTTGSPYRKMLAALWRESPIPVLAPGERVATMAALLHVDREGDSLAAALVARSGLSGVDWLRRYLDAYLVPVLHCFYAHDLVFMPHGENVILVLDERGTPLRVIFKDIAEEIAVMSADTPLPAGVERIRADVPDEMKILSIFTDVFDCFFRFLAAILDRASVVTEHEFWSTVAACVTDYQDSVPELADRFRQHDLFAESFALSCLNRLQLRDNRQMVDLADPAGALYLVGTLANPISAVSRRT